MKGLDYKLLKKKPAVEEAPKVKTLRDVTAMEVKVPSPVLSQDI